jgi:uncharacterized protein YecT (DUF1311 family)
MHLKLFAAAVLTCVPFAATAGACDNVAQNDRLVQCLGGEYVKADAELNRVYGSLFARLDADGKDTLKSSQLAWLRYRDKDCELRASASAGGQAYQPTYIGCQTEKTKRRTAELKEHR